MKTNPLEDGVMTENSAGIGTVTRQMVRERAMELAVINGRTAQEMSKSDWQQAKRELTDDSDVDTNQTAIESAPESERWDPVYGSTGHKVPAAPSADEAKKGAAITSGWWMKASPARNMIKRAKPPETYRNR
jgi:hypothetical protein